MLAQERELEGVMVILGYMGVVRVGTILRLLSEYTFI